jgi:hypothetical protein
LDTYPFRGIYSQSDNSEFLRFLALLFTHVQQWNLWHLLCDFQNFFMHQWPIHSIMISCVYMYIAFCINNILSFEYLSL